MSTPHATREEHFPDSGETAAVVRPVRAGSSARTPRLRSRPIRWPWVVGGVAVIALLVVLIIMLQPPAKPKDAKTVEEVLSGSQIDRRSPEGTTENSALAELARAMGLPQGAFTADESGRTVDTVATRQHLVDNLREATHAGEISSEEADAVLKAYDSGLVDAPVEAVILQSPDQ